MLDHLGFGVSDVASSKAFFTAALAPLGYTAVMEAGGGVGIGIGQPMLWLAPTEQMPAPLHIACCTKDGAGSRSGACSHEGRLSSG